VRAVGLDLGARRIGVAVSDAAGVLASPRGVIERSGDRAADHAAIASLVAEVEAERLVVGVPLSMDGTAGKAAKAAQDEIAELAEVVGVPVEAVDERLTTVSADRALAAAGRKSRGRRKVVDQTAAALILQSWLDKSRA
jgi:putative holliday junction resolvase